MDRVGIAGRARQVRRRGAGVQVRLVLFLGDAGDRQRDPGIRDLHDQIDPIPIEPLPHHRGADIGLVQMIR